MLSKFAAVALLCGLTVSAPSPACAQPAPSPASSAEPATPPAPAPTSKQTADFTSFFTTVLAGHVPGGNVTAQVRQGFTQQLLSQIDTAFAGLGKFRELQFVSADTMQQYLRYHYQAVFENGSQGIMFILDSNGTIVGFFQDKSA
jgi:hypothetical protein